MRYNAHLPRALGGPAQDGWLFFDDAGVERAGLGGLVQIFSLPQDYPTLRDRISSNFHAECFNGPGCDARTENCGENHPAIFCCAPPRPCAVVCLRALELSRTRRLEVRSEGLEE